MPYEITYQEISPLIGNPITVTSDTASIDIQPVKDGSTYKITVVAINTLGMRSAPVNLPNHTVVGKLLPPANITGFTVTPTKYGNYLSWNPNTDIDLLGYEVRKGPTWALGASNILQEDTTSTSFTDINISPGTNTYWVAAVDTSQNYSLIPAPATVNVPAPAALSISYTISGTDYIINWVAPSSLYAIDRYEIRTGIDWASGTLLATTKATVFQNPVKWVGTQNFHISAIDIAGNYSTPSTLGISISNPIIPVITCQVIDNNVLLKWTECKATLPIDFYEIRKGTVFATAVSVGTNSGLFSALFETVGGAYTYWVVGVDTAGNYGIPGSILTQVNQPPDYILNASYNSVFTGGIKNTLNFADKAAGIVVNGTQVSKTGVAGWESIRCTLGKTNPDKLYWETKIINGGTYPNTIMIGVATVTCALSSAHTGSTAYLYYGFNGQKCTAATSTAYGSTFTTGDIIGTQLDMVAGTITFFKNGVSQGIAYSGLVGPLYPIISLFTNTEIVEVNFGSKPYVYGLPAGFNDAPFSNAAIDIDDLSMPHNLTETWTTHFTTGAHTGKPWVGPSAQVAGGYPIFGQPMLAAGYYEETIDYGAVLPANKITVLIDTLGSVGIPGTITTISVSNVMPYVWTNYVGVTSVFATSFRYVKIKIAATSTGTDILNIRSINVKLDSKLINDAGIVQCVNTDTTPAINSAGAGGTLVTFSTPFTNIVAIQINYMGLTQKVSCLMDFIGNTLNPVGFKVYLYDSTGARISGNVSWSAKGY